MAVCRDIKKQNIYIYKTDKQKQKQKKKNIYVNKQKYMYVCVLYREKKPFKIYCKSCTL